MSSIVDKAFDASKRIVRSIFKGSPNLITTSDLNRQLEAFKYQLDKLDEKTGFLSDISIQTSLVSGTLSVTYSYSLLEFKGCRFTPPVSSLSINLTSSAPIAYLCLTASTSEVTYDDDSTHEIAGAKFSDGTAYPAANQIVYSEGSLILTHSLSSVENLVGIVAVIELLSTGVVDVKKNVVEASNSLPLNTVGVIKNYDKNLRGSVSNGKTYDEAFSILENRGNNIIDGWKSLNDSSGSSSGSFKIKNGVFYLNSPRSIRTLYPATQNTLIITNYTFQSSEESILIDYFNSLDISPEVLTTIGAGTYSMYGCFGTFPFYGKDSTENDIMVGSARMGFILRYNSGILDNVFIGSFIEEATVIKETIANSTFMEGPLSGNAMPVEGAKVIYNAGIFTIPFVGA